jgi:hypothetical protein
MILQQKTIVHRAERHRSPLPKLACSGLVDRSTRGASRSFQ